MIDVCSFVRATTWYGTLVKFGVIIEVGPRYIKVETHRGVFTCHRDSAMICPNLTPADKRLAAQVNERLAQEAAA
jgi:hypothetical protein